MIAKVVYTDYNGLLVMLIYVRFGHNMAERHAHACSQTGSAKTFTFETCP